MENGKQGRALGRVAAGLGAGEESDGQLLERFATRQDEAAFEALVRRYGRMVMGVCQRLLHDAHDTEDAFQATFLVLIRKAGSIDRPELLGHWLYGVAHRTALKARARAAKRYVPARVPEPAVEGDPAADVSWREVCAVLDDEMSGLPEKYRIPLVLCYLEGKTNEEAARQLGWPSGSMSGRLARGLELLRKRLGRRGLALSSLLFPLLLSRHAVPGSVPASLYGPTLVLLGRIARGRPGPIADAVNALAEGVLREQAAAGAKSATAVRRLATAVALVILALGAGLLAFTALTSSRAAALIIGGHCDHDTRPADRPSE